MDSAGESVDFVGHRYFESLLDLSLELLDGAISLALAYVVAVGLRLGLGGLALQPLDVVYVLLAVAIRC